MIFRPRLTRFLAPLVAMLASGMTPLRAAVPDDFEQSVAAIQAVGPEGSGNVEAAAAWKKLSDADATAILPLLRAMEKSSPLARNWLRSAVEVIVDRELKAGAQLPFDELGSFLLDVRQSPQGRRLAFDMISRIDPETAKTLVPGFIEDPATELRRDAVKLLMDEGKALAEADKKQAAVLVYRQALNSARDVDQIQEIAKQLTGKLEQEIDLPRHFGFLMNWQVIGPFDNTKREGFDTVFPPEEEIKLDGNYPGKDGKEIGWQPLVSTDEYGKIDLNQPFGPLKEVTGYAFTEFNSAQAQPAELRLSCKNAWKIWLNGELLSGRDEYHRGQRIDQYQLPVQLKAGKNTILVKLCQNEQTQDWTVEWEFKLRVCDATGTAILAVDRPETQKTQAPTRRGRPADAN
ncbi:MAG: hypothetical protein KDN19_03900 [Verrucomicrobiae bacterium]|nr:hypothetical protein [Verrucomicrobiae bacterium]